MRFPWARWGKARIGPAWRGTAEQGLKFGNFDLACRGLAAPGKAGQGVALQGTAKQGLMFENFGARHGWVRLGDAWQGYAGQGEAWNGKAGRGPAVHGTAKRGLMFLNFRSRAWLGKALHG